MREGEVFAYFAERDILQIKKWNKVLNKGIWILFAIMLAFEGIITICYCAGITLGAKFSNTEYILSYLVKPCLVVFFTLLLSKGIGRLIEKHHDARWQSWLIIFTLVIMATEVSFFHYGISIIYAIYVIPIVASLLYKQRRLLFFTYLISVLLYLLVLAYVVGYIPKDQYHHNYMDAIGNIALLTSVYTICRMVLSRTRELIDTAVRETLLRMKLSHEILLDSLTQLYNHASFYQYLDTFILEYMHDKTKPFSLILLDVDNFKSVNDTYGHDVGDEVILRLADTIKKNIRDNDLAFRYGGEEFAVLTNNVKHAFDLAESIRKSFETQIYSRIPHNITVSIGINTYDKSFGGGKREFFSSVDKALYAAKHAGKNCTRIGT